MLTEILNRLEVLAGLNTEIEEARGISDGTWDSFKMTEKKKYIKEHPHSRFALDPKYGMTKMLKTKMGGNSSKVNKSTSIKKSDGSYENYPYITDPSKIGKLLGNVKHKINKDGTVDCFENVLLKSDIIDKNGHFKIKFGKVHGNFVCHNGISLTSLEGSPIEVSGNFDCSRCINLTSLEGAPEKVGGNFNCYDCDNLTSLEGATKEVESFDCSRCRNLTSLKGGPEKVNGSFSCIECESLTSLKGAPKKVGGNFYCDYCINLKSLEGAPKEVGESFSCMECKNLTSLKGGPEKVGGNFNCYFCESLKSLEGAPKEIGEKFIYPRRL